MSFEKDCHHTPKKCKGCIYRATGGDNACDYFVITGKLRGCSVEECEHFEKAFTGKQRRAQRNAMRKKGLT